MPPYPDAQLAAVARQHGVDPSELREVPGGVANRAFTLGDALFLRISRPGYESDLHKEFLVVPTARAAGVLTPEIITYDPTRTVLDTPYLITRRIHGTEPTTLPKTLAQQLATLHHLHQPPAQPANATQAVCSVGVDGLGGLPEDGWGDPWGTVEELVDRGYIDPGTATWLSGWFTRLAEQIEVDGPKVLIHGDVAAHNLLVGPTNDLRALIDWGDAAWAPPATDFAKLPLTQVADLIPDYLNHTHSPTTEHELAAATLWFHLSWALSKLPATPWPNQRHWTAPTTSRLLNLLHFFTTTPPPPWSDLV
ncbi:phosphotransferase family protein [Kribbella sp. NPDC004536]|uniref:phosphotransferase family protein n=1 Tax=Kribbella sp. NPDC004536 TaxID=3364106 RepID=UPI00367E6282